MDNRFFKFAGIKIPNMKEVSGKDWILWGPNNEFGGKLIDLYNKSAIHHTAINSVLDGIIGEGIKQDGSTIINRQGETLDELFKKCTLDYIIFGGFTINVIWNRIGDNWAELYHLPFNRVCPEKPNHYEVVEHYYYSKDWTNTSKNKPLKYPVWNPKENLGTQASQIFYYKDYNPQNDVYPLPSYVGALNDIELDVRISLYHNSNLRRGLSPNLLINIREGGLIDDEKKIAIKRAIEDTYAGEENAGGFFLNFCEPGREMQVDPIQSSNDTYYITLEERITSRILTAHRITSPMLLGIRSGNTGLSNNKDEIIVAYGHFIGTVIDPKQKIMLSQFNKLINKKLIIDPSPIIIDNETVEVEPEKIIDINE